MDINENPFKIMYLFIKDICHKRTNCGAGCPWGLRVRDDSFDGYHYECKLDTFDYFELIGSMEKNKDFLKDKLKIDIE